MAGVFTRTFILILGLSLVSAVPRNEYEFSLKRDKLKKEEEIFQKKLTKLNEDEEIVNSYMQHLKWREFQDTKAAFPPTRPIEQVLGHIYNSSVFKLLRKLPKGGNMHTHEHQILSKQTIVDMLFSSSDFKYLHIQDESGKLPWALDFFVTPPPNAGWVRVMDNPRKYSKEALVKKYNLLDTLSEEAKKYPADSKLRWRDINPLFGRLTTSLFSNKPIYEAHTRLLLKWCLDEGVQLLEARRGMEDRMYVLDPDPKYRSQYGRRVIDNQNGRLEIEILKKLILEFIKDNPSFIGMRRIILSVRSQSNDALIPHIERAIFLHKTYPDLVVGYDLVAEEDAGNSHLFFLKDFVNMYDSKTKHSKIPLLLHTAETNYPDDLITSNNNKDPVATLQNSYEAILYGARRVGHGLGYVKHPYLLNVLKRNNVTVEVCPVSNQILGYTPNLMNHPAVNYLKSGVRVVLGADDPGTFGYNDFGVDWYEAYMGWGLDLADLKQLAQNSILYSTLSSREAVKALQQKWQPEWNKFIKEIKREACKTTVTVAKPVFGRILPREGPIDEISIVHIFGRNFDSGICKNVICKFGSILSKKVKYISNFHIICETPSLSDKTSSVTVPVTVSLDGTTFLSTNENFTYSTDIKKPTMAPSPKPTGCPSPASSLFLNDHLSLLLSSCLLICFQELFQG